MNIVVTDALLLNESPFDNMTTGNDQEMGVKGSNQHEGSKMDR